LGAKLRKNTVSPKTLAPKVSKEGAYDNKSAADLGISEESSNFAPSMENRVKYIRALLLALCLMACTTADAQQRHSNGADDVLQYIPYASVFALKAFGLESRDQWSKLALTSAASWVVAAGTAYALKHTIKEWRPDHSDQHSFPSGHSAIAFAGATALHKEFGHHSPWISVAGFGVATFVAADRIIKDRHHWYDVAAGAAIGFGAAELTWWLSDKVIKNDKLALAFSGTRLDVALRW